MNQHCFVVLELPGGEELKYVDEKSPQSFWRSVAKTISEGRAKIISKRQDTGISEELRTHVAATDKYTTYVLVDLHLHPGHCDNGQIFKKVSSWLAGTGHHKVIDNGTNFQLVTVD